MAEQKTKKHGRSPTRRRKLPGKSTGLEAKDLIAATMPEHLTTLREHIKGDGGSVLATYREPFGANWVLLSALPIALVDPTPYQRNLSDTHVRKLETAIAKVGRFLDPIIVVRRQEKDREACYWTPNGNHRLSAMRSLGAKSIVAIVVPEAAAAYQILALNTEKSHNLRERAIEVIKMYQELAVLGEITEDAYALEFEEAALITLGLCYLENGRFSGGAYHPILRRTDQFLKQPLQTALQIRRERAGALMELDKTVSDKVAILKSRGLTSPYLKSYIVARINPLRFRPKDAEPLRFDAVLERMAKAAEKLNLEKVKVEDLARSGGPPEE